MKKVAVLQDLSSFGKCSLTAAIPVLSIMGVQAVPLPTAILSAQTGYPSYFYEDFTSRMSRFTEEWKKFDAQFDGIYTGFVTGGEQIKNIFTFLDAFHTKETKLFVDPVMGDVGEIYPIFTEELLTQMRELVTYADVITPNVTESCLLAGMSYEKLQSYPDEADYIKALEEVGNNLQKKTKNSIIITGVIPPVINKNPQIGNMYIDGKNTFYDGMGYNGKSYSGTGDLFASVIMGGIMRGESIEKSVQLAVAFLTEAISDSALAHIPEIEGVNFEKYLGMLI